MDPDDRSDRLAFVFLYLALKPAYPILQLAARPFEGVVDGEGQIGIPLVRRRRAFDIDLAAVGERETNMNLIEPARVVMAARALHHHPAGRRTAVTLLEFGNVPRDRVLDTRSPSHALEVDFDRGLHEFMSEI